MSEVQQKPAPIQSAGPTEAVNEPACVSDARKAVDFARELLTQVVTSCPAVAVINVRRLIRAVILLMMRRSKIDSKLSEVRVELEPRRSVDENEPLSRWYWIFFMITAALVDSIGAIAIATASLVPGALLGYVATGITLLPLLIGGMTGLSARMCEQTGRGSTARLIWSAMFIVGVVTGIAYVLTGIAARLQLAFTASLLGHAIPPTPALALAITAALGLCLSFMAEYATESWGVTLLSWSERSLQKQLSELDEKLINATSRLAAAVDEIMKHVNIPTVREKIVVESTPTAAQEQTGDLHTPPLRAVAKQ